MMSMNPTPTPITDALRGILEKEREMGREPHPQIWGMLAAIQADESAETRTRCTQEQRVAAASAAWPVVQTLGNWAQGDVRSPGRNQAATAAWAVHAAASCLRSPRELPGGKIRLGEELGPTMPQLLNEYVAREATDRHWEGWGA